MGVRALKDWRESGSLYGCAHAQNWTVLEKTWEVPRPPPVKELGFTCAAGKGEAELGVAWRSTE